MSSNTLATIAYTKNMSELLLSDVTDGSNTYYFFIGNHTPLSNTVPEMSNGYDDSHLDPYRNMIAGKKLFANNFAEVIRNIPYVSDTVYAMYDDTDTALDTKDYYAVVNAGSYYHVFKCLDNNFGANSTVAPEYSDISGGNTYVYQTSDGYRWKYMFSTDSNNVDKFGTLNYFPLVYDQEQSLSPVPGAIDIIAIANTGRGYHNYTKGTFAKADLKVNGDPTIYAITNSTASFTNGYYSGCIVYISAGTGSGNYAIVQDYFVTETGKYIQLVNAFGTAPTNGSKYEIYPNVDINGDGYQTTNAVARAIINASSSNSVYKIELLDRGSGYTYAAASVVANAAVGVITEASVRPIYSPKDGHGSNIPAELGSRGVMLSTKLANSESNTIVTTNTYRQLGIIKNPLFANVQVTVNSNHGVFTTEESVYTLTKRQMDVGCTINTSSNVVTGHANSVFDEQFVVSDYVYLVDSDVEEYALTQVVSVTNSTSLIVSSIGTFDSSNVTVYLANVNYKGTVKESLSGTSFTLKDCRGTFAIGDLLVGMDSGAFGTVETLASASIEKDFSTYVSMYKYDVSMYSGSFENDETVFQYNTNNAFGYVHSVVGSNVYVTYQSGMFFENHDIDGETSGYKGLINNAYKPDIEFGSGEILYLNNIEPKNRTNNTESFKLFFSY